MASDKSTQSQEDELAGLVECLIDEVRVLRDSVDELTTAFGWATRNGHIEVKLTAADSGEGPCSVDQCGSSFDKHPPNDELCDPSHSVEARKPGMLF